MLTPEILAEQDARKITIRVSGEVIKIYNFINQRTEEELAFARAEELARCKGSRRRSIQ